MDLNVNVDGNLVGLIVLNRVGSTTLTILEVRRNAMRVEQSPTCPPMSRTRH